jgi:hypothetical protein
MILLHSEFPYIRGKFDFLFYQYAVDVGSCMVVMMSLPLLMTGYLIPRFMKGMEKSTACSLS